MQPTYDTASHGSYHAFSYKEKYFLYDINGMNAYQIDEKLFFKLNLNRQGTIFFEELVKSLPEGKNQIHLTDKDRPIQNLILMVAQVCNLSCVYCYGVDGEYGTKGKMKADVAFKSVDFIFTKSKDAKQVIITFFGGEPLLNFPLIKEVVTYSKKKAAALGKEVGFSITTNGTRLNDEVNQYLNEHNFGVVLSFDGDEEIQNKNRPFKNGKGSYQVTKDKVLTFLKSRNGRATARATVTNHSYNLEELENGLLKMGFQHAKASVATLSGYALENRDVDKVSEDQHHHLLSKIENDAEVIFGLVKNKMPLSKYKSHEVLTYIGQLINKNKSMQPCGVGRGMIGVSITGSIYPCHRFVGVEKFNMGSIDKFDEKARETYLENYTETHPICSTCWAKYHCGGRGCIHDNEVTNGDVNSVNTDYCSKLKMNLKNAIYLYSCLTVSDREYLLKSIQQA